MEKTSKRSGDTFKRIMRNQYTVLVAIFVIVVVVFTILKADRYFSPSNLKNILNGAVIISLLAVAESLLILSGHIDLGAGSIGAFAGVAVAMFMRDGLPWPVALIIVLIFGGALGGVNAILVNVFNFQSFISTLAVGTIAEGLGYILSEGVAIPVTNESYYFIGVGSIAGIPFAIILSLVIIHDLRHCTCQD
jgi:ribose/xylose/arabinose/galactoside ABC-type transport system permease subunit